MSLIYDSDIYKKLMDELRAAQLKNYPVYPIFTRMYIVRDVGMTGRPHQAPVLRSTR